MGTRLLSVFRSGGDQDALKVSCASEGAHNIVGQNLARLRSTMHEARRCCAGSSDSAGGLHVRPLMTALLELVSAGGAAGVDEDKEAEAYTRPPLPWEAIRDLAADDSRVISSAVGTA